MEQPCGRKHDVSWSDLDLPLGIGWQLSVTDWEQARWGGKKQTSPRSLFWFLLSLSINQPKKCIELPRYAQLLALYSWTCRINSWVFFVCFFFTNWCFYTFLNEAFPFKSPWIQTQIIWNWKRWGAGVVEWRSSLSFHWSCSSGMLSMRLRQIRLLFPAAGTFELFSQVCLVCQRAARLRKQIRVRTLRRTHPADTKMPFCLMSNRGVAAPNPALSSFFFFPFPPSATLA